MHPEKTRLIEFGRYAAENRRRRGEGGPETFDFLGFTHYCRKDRKGRYGLGRKPIAKRMRRTLKRVKEELSRRMHEGIGKTGKWLGRVLNGWLNYFAVPTSLRYLRRFASHVLRLWMRAINRRSQKGGYSWEAMNRLAATYWPRLGIRIHGRTDECSSTPEGGAGCASCARPDLCGGSPAMRIYRDTTLAQPHPSPRSGSTGNGFRPASAEPRPFPPAGWPCAASQGT